MTSVAYGLAFPATRGVLAFHPAAGGFDPSSLFSGDTGGWWDPSDMATLFQDSAGTTPITAADQPVGRINDQSGNGNDLTQASSSSRPILRNSGALWWLEFDGANDYLVASFTHNQPITRINAIQQVTWSTSDCPFDGVTGRTTLSQYPNSPQLILFAGALGPSISPSLVTNIVTTEIFNGGSSKLAYNNGSYGTGNAGTQNPGGLTVAAINTGADYFADMLWFGGLTIGRVLTDPEIAQARTYFGAKAGVSL
jgi:hypothetical protein